MTSTELAEAKSADPARVARLGLTIGLAIYGFSILRHPGFSLLDNVNLPIHETGHLVFSPFGVLMEQLGGTLFELILPAVFMGYFVFKRDWHASTVALWWIAENLWYISVYVKDARAQELPLVGGGEHDWFNILSHFHALARDQIIGQRFWLAGTMLYVVAIVAGLFALTVPPAPSEGEASAS